MNSNRLPFRDVLLLLAVACAWGLNFVVMRIGLDHFPPLFFCSVRYALCVPLVFVFRPPAASWKMIVLLGFVLGVVMFSSMFLAIYEGLPPGLASMITQLQVFLTMILGCLFLGEKPNLVSWLAMLVALIAVATIIGLTSTSVNWKAMLFIAICTVAWGISNFIFKINRDSKMINLVVWSSLVPPIPLFLLAAQVEGMDAFWNALHQLNWPGVAALIYTSYVSSVWGYGVWGRMLGKHPTILVAPFALLVPVFAVCIAYLVLGEWEGWAKLAAGMVIVFSILINLFSEKIMRYCRQWLVKA